MTVDSPTLQPVTTELDGVGWQYHGGDPQETMPRTLWEGHFAGRWMAYIPAGEVIHEDERIAEIIRERVPGFTNTVEADYFYWFHEGSRTYCHAGDWVVITDDGDLIIVEADRVRSRPGTEESADDA